MRTTRRTHRSHERRQPRRRQRDDERDAADCGRSHDERSAGNEQARAGGRPDEHAGSGDPGCRRWPRRGSARSGSAGPASRSAWPRRGSRSRRTGAGRSTLSGSDPGSPMRSGIVPIARRERELAAPPAAVGRIWKKTPFVTVWTGSNHARPAASPAPRTRRPPRTAARGRGGRPRSVSPASIDALAPRRRAARRGCRRRRGGEKTASEGERSVVVRAAGVHLRHEVLRAHRVEERGVGEAGQQRRSQSPAGRPEGSPRRRRARSLPRLRDGPTSRQIAARTPNITCALRTGSVGRRGVVRAAPRCRVRVAPGRPGRRPWSPSDAVGSGAKSLG